MNLYKFQQEGLNRVKNKQNVALFWEMGTGKTHAGTEKMLSFDKRLNLVICQKSKVKDWVNHINSTGKAAAYPIHPKMDSKAFYQVINDRRIKLPLVLVVNYELLWRRQFFADVKFQVIMLDESSTIQNDKAKVTKFILAMEHEHIILLSGTPCSGKYENLWSQAYLLGWDISKTAFDATYVNWESFYVGKMIHYRPAKDNPYINVERLKRKLREHGADFLKSEECIDLPEQTIIKMEVDKSKEYDKFKKDRYITFGDRIKNELVGDSIMALRIGLRKLCTEYSDCKIQAVHDLLQSSNERFVIFYNWNSELRHLMTLCDELGKPISIINGKEKDLADYEKEENSVTLIQYQAGAMGLNLQKANRVIYFSLPERSDLFEQSKKRIHRIGQNRKCFYYVPVTNGSIEESIYECLLKRKDYTDELFREEMKWAN